ncbi:hypothetical protein F5148DRAFT_89304 [Russula earlei]|uniref:Uncharacterized protein n=1 Tax=Russula earlei TaxID=71964 RepID=A0ACC0U952_9AGAM|nr:hypothetical protein F5148DRAFT_89304 [Russula earlei]
MTSRPSFSSKRRPLSAIFLGDGSTPSSTSSSELPDLPEPPSPGAASTHSGLPSPPATNSTGSGSTGDRRENDIPTMPPPSSALTNRGGRPSTSRSSRASSPAGSGEYKKEQVEEEEDNTARINLGGRRGADQTSNHIVTLQRVMSLTQRNRMALNKLSSMRLNTPSPSQSTRSPRSPRFPNGAPASRSSTSPSTNNRSRSVEPAALSGSETEREPGVAAYSNSSDDQSVTPPSSVSRPYSVLDGRLRRTSLPASPSKGKGASSTRSFSPGSSQRTPKKRVSIMSVPDPEALRELGQNDITSAALATVASLRRSPGSSGKKNRQPLPREFREREFRRASSDGRASKEPTTPQKPSRERYTSLIDDTSPSRASMRRALNNQHSPPQTSQVSRLSTARKHQTRWMSEDLRTTSSRPIVDDNEDDDPLSSSSDLGNRPSARNIIGNPPSARLIGESLRAAGMGVKSGADAFREAERQSENATVPPRPMSIAAISSQVREAITSPNRVTGLLRTSAAQDPRTPDKVSSYHRTERGSHSGPQSRPTTSMADFHPIEEDLLPLKTAPFVPRTYKNSFTSDRDREGMGSRQALYTPFSSGPQERTYGSPRTRPPALPLDEQALEHLRLMDESLTMFEALLSRLPPMGDTPTTTVPEVFRSAQAVVRFSEQVNGMLRTATNRALERLIESEVSDASPGDEIDMVGLWKDVGGDLRDMLRVSDELVRTMTGFLLGVGKVLRESSVTGAGPGSSLQHFRCASDDLSRRSGADGRSSTSAGTGSGRGSGSGDGVGRRSTESRRSWDLPRIERDKSDLTRRASSRIDVGVLSGQRASSSMLLRERDPPRPLGLGDDVSPSARPPVTSSVRRSFTPGLQREGTLIASAKPELPTIESQRSLHIEDDYEPSPTPASRSRQPDGSTRNLPALPVPSPLPTSSFEAHADQSALPSMGDKSANRRKISTASTATLRAGTSVNPGLNITTPSAAPTTAVTPHTVTPVLPPLPISRTDSGHSSSSGASSSRHSTTVTFSRPLTVSVSTLSGLQQRDARNRATSNDGPTPKTPLSATSPWTSQSGSETERPQPRLALGRRTLGVKSHLSLDAPPPGGTQTLARSTARERRRTITEIFS